MRIKIPNINIIKSTIFVYTILKLPNAVLYHNTLDSQLIYRTSNQNNAVLNTIFDKSCAFKRTRFDISKKNAQFTELTNLRTQTGYELRTIDYFDK